MRKASVESSKSGLYLTYIGDTNLEEKDQNFGRNHAGGSTSQSVKSLPVLEDISFQQGSGSGRTIFSTLRPDCGTIELSRYGVRPFPHEGKLDGIFLECSMC